MLAVEMERQPLEEVGKKRKRGRENEAFIRPVSHKHRTDAFAFWDTRDDVFHHWFPRELTVKNARCEVTIYLWMCLIANLPLIFLS